MTSKFRIMKSLEWCTELPTKECPRKSPVFLANGNEGFFLFVLEKPDSTWYFDLHLEFECMDTKFKPCGIKLQVGFSDEETFSLGNTTVLVSEPCKKEIWYISATDLQRKRPAKYTGGDCIKFSFVFVDVALLKISEEVDNKYVQTSSYMNADVAYESVCGDFSRLLDSGPNHDAEIKCGEHSIKVHKIVLCSRSEVFSAMLQSDMLEGRTGAIEIEDMDISHVQDFIRYLYTGSMPELNFDKAKILYEAGYKYAARGLMLRCSEYFEDNLSAENFFKCFTLADTHSDQKLKDRVITYILEEKIYLQEEIWLPFCKSYPQAALEIYRLSYKNDSVTRDINLSCMLRVV